MQMELTLKYILEENKLGSNRFLDALKKGNKDNLDLYFNFANSEFSVFELQVNTGESHLENLNILLYSDSPYLK